jgi:hypothetical protein
MFYYGVVNHDLCTAHRPLSNLPSTCKKIQGLDPAAVRMDAIFFFFNPDIIKSIKVT